MLQIIGRWFEPACPSQDYKSFHYTALALMLAVGAVLRFWNLGNVGLHGDEDLMGLAAKGVLEHGYPLMPAGWVYTRALLNTYIIAGSMWLFGETEWAMRFPSAVLGSALGLFAFLMGRRFLAPNLNLVFAAVMIFLPAMIEVSQTARMYVFLVAALLIFGALLFRWERTERAPSLIWAFIAWCFAVHFQPLAVLAAPLFLFPGLARSSRRLLVQGCVALGLTYPAYRLAGRVAGSGYPREYDRIPPPPDTGAAPMELLADGPMLAVILIGLAMLVAMTWFASRRGVPRASSTIAVLLLAVGLGACLVLHYHVGLILLVFGSLLWLRANPTRYAPLLVVLAGLLMIAILQLVFLHGTGEFQGRQLIGALVGTPSVWPMLRFAQHISVAGALLMLASVVYVGLRFAKGDRVPTYMLFFAIAVWLPFLVIGLAKWDVPYRYMLGIVPFFFLSMAAGISFFLEKTRISSRLTISKPWAIAICTLVVLAVVNPLGVWLTASNDYRSFPDHKGVAEFIKSLDPGPGDILIAEDSINQTFYLGKVDYRLQDVAVARTHSIIVNGVLVGQYTATPIMGSGAELEAVLDDPDIRGEIYVIGDGLRTQEHRDRGNGIAEVLASGRLEPIFTGRDGTTVVWRRRHE